MLTESDPLLVTWPNVTLTPPHVTVDATRDVITVDVDVDVEFACDDVTAAKYTLELVYYGTDAHTASTPLRAVYTSRLYRISRRTRVSFAVSCNSTYVPPGLYRTRISASSDPRNPIQTSAAVWINQTGTEYSLQSTQPLVPCLGDHFPVSYVRPPCFGSTRDVIRIYRKQYRVPRLPASPYSLRYVGERRTGAEHEGEVRFSCEVLDDASVDEEICIKYTSISPEGVVSDKHSICFKADGRPIGMY